MLASLRGSLAGAWLACAYGLAVLAAALSPGMALGHDIAGNTVFCSGLSLPSPEVPAPVGDLEHCKGCPANPAPALPPAFSAFTTQRDAAAFVPAIMAAVSRWPAIRPGLPQARAPPAA